MTSRRRSSGSGMPDVLQKPLPPRNPRYAHVKPTVDTGASFTKVLENPPKNRRGELFKRVKVSTLAQLVIVREQQRQSEEDSAPSETQGSLNASVEVQPPTTPQESPTSVSATAGMASVSLTRSPAVSNIRRASTASNHHTNSSQFAAQVFQQQRAPVETPIASGTLGSPCAGTATAASTASVGAATANSAASSSHALRSPVSNAPSSPSSTKPATGNASSLADTHASLDEDLMREYLLRAEMESSLNSSSSQAVTSPKSAALLHKEVLVLDLRDEADFDQCHIRGAVSFPASRLSRSMNHFTPQILTFRNSQHRIIVVYDLEERQIVSSANVFVERGFDNVFVLSGGLAVFAAKFPALVNGCPPSSPVRSSRPSTSATSSASPLLPASPLNLSSVTAASTRRTSTSHTFRSMSSRSASGSSTSRAWK